MCVCMYVQGQMDKQVGNEMETGGLWGTPGSGLRYSFRVRGIECRTER